uniref:Uncharacterized protein n=1 Tax=Arundo donax TaxID=35708 RepID=A0A0A9B345_ARUDO
MERKSSDLPFLNSSCVETSKMI